MQAVRAIVAGRGWPRRERVCIMASPDVALNVRRSGKASGGSGDPGSPDLARKEAQGQVNRSRTVPSGTPIDCRRSP